MQSGITEEHLRELGMKIFVRARVAAAIAELRARSAAEGLTPLQTADQRVEVARLTLLTAQKQLAAAEASLNHARRLTIHIVGFGTCSVRGDFTCHRNPSSYPSLVGSTSDRSIPPPE